MFSIVRSAVAALTVAFALCACGHSAAGAFAPRVVPAHALASSGNLGTAASAKIYVLNYDTSNVTEYPIDANGDVAPLAKLAGRRTLLANPEGIALDAGGNIYVSNAPYTKAPYPQFAVFAPGADGDAAPIRQISARLHGDAVPFGIAVDRAGYLYEADTNSLGVKVFAPKANGDVAPVRVIGGNRTGIHDPYSVTVDAAGHAFVPDGSDVILEFAAGAGGNVAPIAAIRGPHTRLNGPVSVALDASGNLYVSSLLDNVLVFPAGANGDVAPARTMTLTPQPHYEGGLALRGNELFVVQSNVGMDDYSVDVYRASDSGISRPIRKIAGPHTQLDGFALAVH